MEKYLYKIDAKTYTKTYELNGGEWLSSRSSRVACVQKYSVP